MKNDNNRSLYSLVIDVVEDLFLNETTINTVAIITKRRKAARKNKSARKGVHQSLQAQKFLREVFKYDRIKVI
jgi:hypothetical protein